MKPPFRTRTDLSRRLATINKTFPVDCAKLQPQKNNLQINVLRFAAYVSKKVFSGNISRSICKKTKSCPMHSSELTLHQNCSFDNPYTCTHRVQLDLFL